MFLLTITVRGWTDPLNVVHNRDGVPVIGHRHLPHGVPAMSGGVVLQDIVLRCPTYSPTYSDSQIAHEDEMLCLPNKKTPLS